MHRTLRIIVLALLIPACASAQGQARFSTVTVTSNALTALNVTTGGITTAGLLTANGGIAVDTNFTVSGTNGNTAIAGTLLVGGSFNGTAITGTTITAGVLYSMDGLHVGNDTDPGLNNALIDGTLGVAGAVAMDAKITEYNNVATAGWGVPAIVASGRSVAQTAAVATVATYTVGAADGSFEVSGNVLVTTATTHSFRVLVAYTDEGNTARTGVLEFLRPDGVPTIAMVFSSGAIPYSSLGYHIRAKAGTTITIATAITSGGNFTSVVYNVEGTIKQIS